MTAPFIASVSGGRWTRSVRTLLATAGLIVSLAGCSTMAPAGAQHDADLDRLAAWMQGDYDNTDQVHADATYLPIRLYMVPVWTERTDGRWLYVEQAVIGRDPKPYRQRIYRLARDDAGGFVSEVYELPGPELHAQAWRSDGFANLSPSQLILRSGCTVFLRDEGDAFRGSTRDRDCLSDLQGAQHATAQVEIRDGRMDSWDRGYDAAGTQVWGATSGPYVFVRRAAYE